MTAEEILVELKARIAAKLDVIVYEEWGSYLDGVADGKEQALYAVLDLIEALENGED